MVGWYDPTIQIVIWTTMLLTYFVIGKYRSGKNFFMVWLFNLIFDDLNCGYEVTDC